MITLDNHPMSIPDAPLPAGELAALFGFTLDDLALNRAGHLSARQRQDVLYRNARVFVSGAILALISVIVLAAFYRIVPRRAWFTLLALDTVLLTTLALTLRRFVLRPPIHTTTGTIRRGTDAWTPSIIVHDTLALRISTRRWKRLPESLPGTYRVYYGPDQRVLSLEPERLPMPLHTSTTKGQK